MGVAALLKGDHVEMNRVKLMVAMLVAVMGIGAIASTSALAAGAWYVEGKKLEAAAELANTAKVVTPGVLSVPAINLEFECTKLSGIGPKILPGNTGEVTSLIFSGCTNKSTECVLEGTEIGTLPITATATTGTGTSDTVEFKPKTKKVFATLKLGPGTCSLTGVQGVSEHANVSAPTGQTESVEQEIVANTGVGELKVATDEAKLTGKAKLKLKSGSKWSFHS
jgi:hypothetical protein